MITTVTHWCFVTCNTASDANDNHILSCLAACRTPSPWEVLRKRENKHQWYTFSGTRFGLLVTGQTSVAADSESYHYLTHSYQGNAFVTYEVTKKSKQIPLSWQESWLNECEWLSYTPSTTANTASCSKSS